MYTDIHFSDTYRCLSSAIMDRSELEETGRILLPDDAMNSLLREGYDADSNRVMFFCIKNNVRGTEAYAGVQDFTMPPGQVCLPYWLMEFLQCKEGDIVNVSFVRLPRATKAVFQPLSSNFYQIPNPGVVLEYTLRAHPCLTQGSTIIIKFNNKVYRLKVLKTEPKKGVQIFKNDVVCEFAPAFDEFVHHWKEPDLDSSDGDLTPQVKTGRTLKGKVIQVTETLKPRHSTYAQRENDRLHGNIFRTREIVQGQEIAPPKPPEKSREKDQKINFLEGQGRVITKRKSKNGKESNFPPPTDTESTSTENVENSQQNDTIKKSCFTGIARTIDGDIIEGEPDQSQPSSQQFQQQPQKNDQKSSFFRGTPRKFDSTNNQSVENFSNQHNQKKTQTTHNTKKNYFDGPCRKISDHP